MSKSTRDYIKRKLEQSQTHCQYIHEHLSFIEDKYSVGNYVKYLHGIHQIMKINADLDTMLKEFRKVV